VVVGGCGAGIGCRLTRGRAAEWMHAAVHSCYDGKLPWASGGGAVTPGCGGGHGGQGQGEIEKRVLGSQMKLLSFLCLVNRPVLLNGLELNHRGRYRDSVFEHQAARRADTLQGLLEIQDTHRPRTLR